MDIFVAGSIWVRDEIGFGEYDCDCMKLYVRDCDWIEVGCDFDWVDFDIYGCDKNGETTVSNWIE